MRIKTTYFVFILLLLSQLTYAQTSWKGTTSTSWWVASNWTNGVPSSATDVIIGDANFTGGYQPDISRKAFVKSITIGTSTKSSTLTIGKNVTVYGSITIGSNGSIVQEGNTTIKLTGNWYNTGNYTATHDKGNVTFAGAGQTLNGFTTFKNLTVNTGCTLTLGSNISVAKAMTISGTFDPCEGCTVSGAGTLTVEGGGVLLVKAANYSSNYALSGITTLKKASTVYYASSALDQNISTALTYDILRIGGGTIKTLTGNLPALNSTAAECGRIYVDAGTFDLSTYTANRGTSVAGGSLIVAGGATLKIGGTNTFPVNYAIVGLAPTSIVEYYGGNQTVADYDYGDLMLKSNGGAVVKTMPATALYVSGNLTANVGTGTSVTFTAANTITVNRNITLGAGCTFNGSSYTHHFLSNWNNDGTFNGNTSTASFEGLNAVISGSGANNFYNLDLAVTGVTASGNTTLNVSGNLSSTGSGTFNHNASGTLNMSGASKTISGTGIHLYNLTISGSITTSSDILISGNFTCNNSFSANGGIITLDGTAKSISGSGSKTFNSVNIFGTINTDADFTMLDDFSVSPTASFTASAGTATFDGTSSLTGTAHFYNVIISSGKTLILGSGSLLGIANTLSVAGALNVTSSTPNTVEYNAAGAQNVLSATYDNLKLSNGNTKTALGAVTVNKDLTINSSTVFNAGSFTHSLYRHFYNNGTLTASTSTFQLTGSDAATLSGITTFNNLIVNKNSTYVTVTLLSNITTKDLTMTTGNMNTGNNAIIITGTRSGNGIILGTITHNHAFADATAYYFEGPQNAVTFSSPDASLTSVSVTVKSDEVTDFIPGRDCVTREYSISIPAGSYTNATLRLHYEDNELNAFVEPYLSLFRFVSGTTWDSIGYTSRDISQNYVERNSLTSITGRWALSGLRSVVRWNGSVSTAWENPANWSTISGADLSNRVPGPADAAQIGYGAFTYQPALSSNDTVNVLNFGSVQAATLSINSTYTLTTLGTVKGDWSTARSHVLDVSSGNLMVGTHLNLGNCINGDDIELKIGTGSVTVKGNLKQCATSAINFTGNGNLTVYGNYNYTGGTFTPNSGTVIYTGGSSQVIAPVTYYNLSFDKSTEQAILNYPAVIGGNLTMSTGGNIIAMDSVTVNGNVTIGPNVTFSQRTLYPVNVKGNWTNNGTFDMGNGTVCFNGTGNQTVSATSFNTLKVNKSSGTLTLQGNLSFQGDLNIIAGTMDLATYAANRSNPGGTLTIGANGLLKLAGTDNFPANFNICSLNTGSTVEYNGTVAQNIKNLTYGNLTLSNGGSNKKSVVNDLWINGDLLINAGAAFDPSSHSVTLYGNGTNNGTMLPGTATFIFGGSNKTFTGRFVCNNVEFIGSYALTGDTLIGYGDVLVDAAGTANLSNPATQTFVYGDFIVKGNVNLNGSVYLMGTREQSVQLQNTMTAGTSSQIIFLGNVRPIFNSTNSPAFYTVKIYNTAGVLASDVPWTVHIALIIGPGVTFDGGSQTHTIHGHFYNYGTVYSTGTIVFEPIYFPVDIQLDNNTGTFYNTGTVVFSGTMPFLSLVGTSTTFNNLSFTNTSSYGIQPQKSLTVYGNMFIGPGTTCNAGAGLHHYVGGTLTDNGTMDPGTTTITFVGENSSIEGIGSTTLYNLELASTANFTLRKSINIAKDLIIKTANYSTNGYGITFTGNTASAISSTVGALTFDYLEQNKTGTTTTLSTPISLTNELVMTSGVIMTTETNLLTLLDNASATPGNAGSYVEGPMTKIGDDAFVFPLGKSAYWARIGISAPALTTDAFTARYYDYGYADTSVIDPLHNISKIEYWTLDRTAGSSNVAVTLFWENSPRSGIYDVSDLVVAKYNGSDWIDMTQAGGTTGSLSAGTVTSTTVSSFSPFTFGSKTGINTLPVGLTSFNATCNGNSVAVTWSTATETNNDYFTIQKSSDAESWTTVTTVKGAGNSNAPRNYNFNDYSPNEGNTTYYRLTQTDFDGDSKSYDPVTVSCVELYEDLDLFPNPASDIVICSFTAETVSEVTLVITNNIGDILFSEKQMLKEGFNSFPIELSQFPSGYFHLLIYTPDGKIAAHKQFIVKH